ncbi:MAG: glycine zipper 2TM domain-containing protein [Burkholderiales bacterium]|nr:MAG: glycine zipper 2TM domain-containing protein [Burkholderiales bacterium]
MISTLAACATSSPDVYRREQAMRPQTIQSAVVESVRDVKIEGSQSGIGATSGAVVGGVAGSSVGGRRESIAVGVIGAVVGGVAGNLIERSATTEQGQEITVRLASGQRQVVVQAKGDAPIVPGQEVNLISDGRSTRVVPAGR